MEGNGKGIVFSASEAMIRVAYGSDTKCPGFGLQYLGVKSIGSALAAVQERKQKQIQNGNEGVTRSVER